MVPLRCCGAALGLLVAFALGETALAAEPAATPSGWPGTGAVSPPNWSKVLMAGYDDDDPPIRPPVVEDLPTVGPTGDPLAESALLFPAPSPPGMPLVPGTPDHSYPAQSPGAFDTPGSYLDPESLGPRWRPAYPYNAEEYWYGHDADVENWGDLLELPYVRLGWFINAEATLYFPQISPSFNSGTYLQPTFATPVTLGASDLDRSIMPKLELGYRYEHGLGDIRAGYRYLGSSGSEALGGGYDSSGQGTLSSEYQIHVLDVDLNILEFNSEGLPLFMPLVLAPGRLGLGKPLHKGFLLPPLEYRMYFGARVATFFYESIGSGDLMTESVTNTFQGAGVHFGWDMNQQLRTDWPLFLHMRAEGSGIFGLLSQRFSRTTLADSATGGFKSDGIGVPTVDLEIGLAWAPHWPYRDTRFLLAYRYEEWFSWANTSDSQAELYLNGILLRGEYKF
ncbi:MAG: hypothetical protein SFU86_10175 [Pirellulaceae bacterium]|nr:hypothetical protein [Pirellulaceae bacterium]